MGPPLREGDREFIRGNAGVPNLSAGKGEHLEFSFGIAGLVPAYMAGHRPALPGKQTLWDVGARHAVPLLERPLKTLLRRLFGQAPGRRV